MRSAPGGLLLPGSGGPATETDLVAVGVPAELAELADARVRIPMRGRAESLNLAAAAAICLYATQLAQD